jgi:hypothetical protein
MDGVDVIYRVMAYLAIVSAAMLMGLLITLLSVFRSIWDRLDERAAAAAFQDFLRHAATNRVLSTLTIVPIISAIVIAFLDAPAAKYTCALAGGGVFLFGFFAWTAAFNQPIYRIVANWRPATTTPPNTRAVIARFHLVNVGRLISALATTILFFAAV